MLEMKLVIRAVLERFELRPAGERPEAVRRRSITISLARAGEVILHLLPSDRAHAERVPAGARAAA